MAIGQSARSLELQRQLAADLATGSPIPYRRVPGKNRVYFNPRTGDEVSEHYVVRIYKPALSEIERSEINRQVRINTRQQAIQLNSLADTWRAKQAALGTPIDSRNVAKKNAEFRALYNRFKVVSYNARQSSRIIEDRATRDRLYDGQGEYAQLLVALGRRRQEDTFMVGESAKAVGEGGSYINEIVLPALRAQTQS